ncbi:hypothetical protein SAMN04489713_101703 [Actinomadura madurae]|uniref:Uncharacterized protein n=1 Tax=Actinomadura madurae TaxID=1993 RepID=A0A1I4X7Q5_9ACTN|nr:hypothetical protein SAMN04489713_101703 [Actinomadura madurae]SPT63320.1 Uncharacterised protein [Actinomadura madurae]
MALWKPDPTFYASPRDAASAPPERLARGLYCYPWPAPAP